MAGPCVPLPCDLHVWSHFWSDTLIVRDLPLTTPHKQRHRDPGLAFCDFSMAEVLVGKKASVLAPWARALFQPQAESYPFNREALKST